jgi:ABC-type phosphate transport system substrate-binding protein
MGVLTRAVRLPLLGVAALLAVSASPRRSVRASAGADVVVVVGAQVSVRDIALTDLRAIYLGELQTWPGGIPIVPINLARGSAPRTTFDEAVLGIESTEVERYWLRRKLRGEGNAPREVTAGQAVLRLVAAVPGAIGYLSAADLHPGLEPVQIDGAAPGAPGYAIRSVK